MILCLCLCRCQSIQVHLCIFNAHVHHFLWLHISFSMLFVQENGWCKAVSKRFFICSFIEKWTFFLRRINTNEILVSKFNFFVKDKSYSLFLAEQFSFDLNKERERKIQPGQKQPKVFLSSFLFVSLFYSHRVFWLYIQKHLKLNEKWVLSKYIEKKVCLCCFEHFRSLSISFFVSVLNRLKNSRAYVHEYDLLFFVCLFVKKSSH